ncbi:MAG TPA: hypothetical protein PKZ36_00040 [Candidatus Paceibacterota bacterium]|nr:hypothetical protein [Candidatus Paceibacterota bacterium]HPT17794.1 hypothetical protein [Candidatus Paceibacterota bacterium]
MSKDNKFLIFILFLVALEAFLFFLGNAEKKEKERIEAERITKIQNAFMDANISAKAFSVNISSIKDQNFGKNQDESLPLASLSKVVTIISALSERETDEIIKISRTSFLENTKDDIYLNEKWKVDDLIKFILVSSSNTGALALSNNDSEIFIKKMNDFAKQIDAQKTVFYNSTGLDISKEQGGSYGSAKDMNTIALYAIDNYPDFFNSDVSHQTVFKSKSGKVHNVKNTNTLIDKIPNLIFSKTGFTTFAGGNLTVVFKNKIGDRIAITLLGSTKEGRFTDMEELVKIAYNLEY